MFRERLEKKKLGHQAPIGWRINLFNSIDVYGDLAYCASHNFMYNSKEEQRKLYYGIPCYYTDARFYDGRHNFYKNSKIHWTRWKNISLKTCIRKVMRCKGIPKGTIVMFKKSWYYPKTNVDNSYKFVVKKENPVDVKYEINEPECSVNFTECEFSQKLTDTLRANGFIVMVNQNKSFLLGMLNTARTYANGEPVDDEIEGETAVAYGYGKKIGFSSFNHDYMGYTNGMENILWDRFGEFDKWSRCNQISKDKSIEEIINILKE